MAEPVEKALMRELDTLAEVMEQHADLTDAEWLAFADGAGFLDDPCPRCGLPRCEWNMGIGPEHRVISPEHFGGSSDG